MSTDLWRLGASDLLEAYERGELSPREVVRASVERIESVDPLVGAFTTLTLERATEEADACTEELAGGTRRGPLHGVPVAIKELFDVEGARTSYGSTIFRDRVAEEDAEAVRRLRSAGAIVLGLARSHEFGWGITTQHAELGSTRNPWDLERVPGGSSGGAAAAIATGMAPLALGSDTGGSIRIPAAFCGVAGLKPTYGRLSKRGAAALAPSLDHPGPLARDVRDLALALSVLAGWDPDDLSTLRTGPPGRLVEPTLGGLRVGLAPDLHLVPLRPDHQDLFDSLTAAMGDAGAELREVRIPGARDVRPTFATIQMAEAYHVHSRVLGTFPGRAGEYGADVRGRLDAAAEVTLDDYLDALERRARIRRRFELAFGQVDVLLTPVSAGGPSTVDAPDRVDHLGEGMAFRDLVMDYTVPQNLTGLPACSVRAGFDADGLPVGVQVTAPALREDVAMGVALALEQMRSDLELAWPVIGQTAPRG